MWDEITYPFPNFNGVPDRYAMNMTYPSTCIQMDIIGFQTMDLSYDICIST